MSKAKDAMRYALANEARFDEMTGAQKLDELRRLRQGRVKAVVALGKATIEVQAP